MLREEFRQESPSATPLAWGGEPFGEAAALTGVKKFVNLSHIACPVAGGAEPRRAVFLDRDGVIVEETHYLHRVEDVRFIAGALHAVAAMSGLGFAVVVVTNQAGIGRGYYAWEDFERVQEYIERELAKAGGWFDGVWACAYHPEGAVDAAASRYRKPNPGMLEEAAAELGLDLRNSWLVGDKPSDIGAALNAGLHRAVHLLTGHGSQMREEVRRLVQGAGATGCEVLFRDSIQDLLPLLEPYRPGRQDD